MGCAVKAESLAELKAIVGEGGWLDPSHDLSSYIIDFRRLYRGTTPLVLLPRDVAQVSRILAVCHREGIGLVPQGGNTSYCGGATPDESSSQVLLAMRRMNRVRRLDTANDSMIVEAGCTLAEAHAAADGADRIFPLTLGSQGSAQIGGNLATNAGGTAVLRYGMMRDLVLGLEVVLADGRLLHGLKALRKDNTGYDVKSLFIGAEGTLGVITAAVLKLFAKPRDSATALIGVADPKAALELLALLKRAAGDGLTTFELMPRFAVTLAVRHVPGVANPLEQGAAWYVLAELTSPNPRHGLAELLGGTLHEASAGGIVLDASLAFSVAQAQAMWKLRESIPEGQRRHGASLKHDVAVPVSRVPELIERGFELIERLAPEGQPVTYGHVGDGNLHFNVSQRPEASAAVFLARAKPLEAAIFDLVDELDGSFSAEHGIGRLKAAELAERADPVELSVMHAIKHALDPRGILNPGKVLT